MSEDANGAGAVPSTYELLAARFPASAHKTRKQGGRDLTYVDGEMVVSRLNEALGFDGWSFEVKGVTVLEDEVWAQGRLTVYVGDRTVVREQTGGQIINRKAGVAAIPARPAVPAEDDRPEQPAVPAQPARKGDVIELANDIKGAVTDCLKKCATLIGVGLYLYDPNERREVENEMAAAKRGGNRPAPTPQGNAPAPSGQKPTPSSGVGGSSTAAHSNERPTPPQPAGYFCIECHGLVKTDTTVTIPKSKKDPATKVTVSVAEFAPVVEQRLGGFHCPGCYEKKWIEVA